MKRLKFKEANFRVVTYNPQGGWVASIYDGLDGPYFNPIIRITGLKNRDDALLKIGAEIRGLQLSEIDPLTPFRGETTNINYGGLKDEVS